VATPDIGEIVSSGSPFAPDHPAIPVRLWQAVVVDHDDVVASARTLAIVESSVVSPFCRGPPRREHKRPREDVVGRGKVEPVLHARERNRSRVPVGANADFTSEIGASCRRPLMRGTADRCVEPMLVASRRQAGPAARIRHVPTAALIPRSKVT